ncbi:MAG: acetylxylan esterase, partial [Planctomycetota bacterium]
PERLEVPLTAKADLEDFWRATREALAEVDPQFELIAQPDQDTETHELFEVRMRSLGDVRVGGWYQKPKAPGEHPAVLRVPGYTENMRPIELDEPIAIFSFNVRGHGNSQEDVSGQPVDYWVRGLDDKQGYFYQGAYADCLRAVDFLASRPEVDQRRLAVTGGSQGGGLSLATAALDERIDLCAPDIPFLCDWVKYFKTTHWPEMDQWIAADEQRTWETTLGTMGYFDALNLAGQIRCPVFLGLGLQDDVCPPATIFSVYNRLEVPKQYYVYPHAGHWVDREHSKRQWTWLQEQFAALKRAELNGAQNQAP